jgi:hypothetical protein
MQARIKGARHRGRPVDARSRLTRSSQELFAKPIIFANYN